MDSNIITEQVDTAAEVDLTIRLSVKIVGEWMNTTELGDLITRADDDGALARAVRKALRCRQQTVGWTPDGNREALLVAILDIATVETGTRYLREKGNYLREKGNSR